MRERRGPTIPEGVTILKEVEEKGSTTFVEMSLSEFPDEMRDEILGWARFVKLQTKIHPNPLYASRFSNNGTGEVKFKIVKSQNGAKPTD